jgi:hypothetical protein
VAGVDEEHQGQQGGHLAVIGPGRVERPSEANRLLGQVDPDQGRSCRAGVTLVEDQVQDPEDSVQPAFEFVGGGEGEGDAAVFDRLLGPGDPAGHGLLGAK